MKKKIAITIIGLTVMFSVVACGNKDSLTEPTETNSIVEDRETIETEVVTTESDDMSETIEDDSIVYETDSIEETMELIDYYGTNGIDNYSLLRYQFYTDTLVDEGEYYTVKCDIYCPVRVDNGLSIGDMVEISLDKTKNDTHKLIYEAENYLIDKDTGVKYYYNPDEDGKKIILFKYEEPYPITGDGYFYIENEELCKIYTGVIKLGKMAEVVTNEEGFLGVITNENISKSNGWFNQVAFDDNGEAIWICESSVLFPTNRTSK